MGTERGQPSTTEKGATAVALFGYNRPNHLERCIASLQKNPESAATSIFCFLDGPRTPEDVSCVERVRALARCACGFRDVTIIERDHNWGISRNIISGVTQVLADRQEVIVVEDDLVVSPVFLSYMNLALQRYRCQESVFSVSAYNYPQHLFRVPHGYPYDAFFVTRHMCWGWGTWKDRWVKADWRLSDYKSLKTNDSWRRSFTEAGIDLPGMLDAQVRGEVDSWAIRWTYAHFAHHAVCLVPVESFVNNLGVDGSGVHMNSSSRYFHPALNTRTVLEFPPLVYVDPVIARSYRTMERRSLPVRAYRKLSRVLRRAKRPAGSQGQRTGQCLPAALN